MSAIKQVLLVEGRDDKHVILCLLKHHSFPEIFEIIDKDGVENLLKVLPVQLKASGLEALGVVLDADIDLAARWNSIKSILTKAGYDVVPGEPAKGGTLLIQPALPRAGVWLMPDNTAGGMLEDFVVQLVPKDDQVLASAKAAVAIAAAIPAPFKGIHTSKAEIHTWLAWQDDPGTPLGLAITKKYLDPEAVSASSFLNWLNALFVP